MWPCPNKKEQQKQNTVSFKDILTGLQDAVCKAQEMLQNSQLQNLSNFWYPNGQPVSQQVQIGDKVVDLPLIVLVPHNQLAMDTVKISFTTRVGNVVAEEPPDLLKSGNLMGDANSQDSLSSADFQMLMAGAKADGEGVMQVSITFKTRDTPDAVSRLVDRYNVGI